MDFYNFYTGKEFEAYQYLGAHVWDGGTTFRTFAPAAQRVSVIGEFNGWTETPMNRVHDGNFWWARENGEYGIEKGDTGRKDREHDAG